MSSISDASSGTIQADYMKILIEQLRHQNPLEPMNNNEMASQLAMFSQLQQVSTVFLFIVFFIFIVLAYKVFQTLMKALVVGVIAAAFPIVANLIGMDVALSLNSILWFAIAGVALYFAYAFMSGGVKIVKIATSPFRFIFRKKEKKHKQKT